MKLSNTARSAAADSIVDLIDAGGAGTIGIRTGAAPTNTTDGNSGTLLATLTFSGTAFGSASSGVATANSITSDTSIDNTGSAGHYRIYSGAGTVIMQGPVGTGTEDIVFNSISFVSGGTCAITSLTLTVPAGSNT